MNSRERVLAAATREKPDRIPMNLWLPPRIIERLKDEYGIDDFASYFKTDLRFIDYKTVDKPKDYSRYTKEFHPETWINNWGCGYYRVGHFHFTKGQHPMKNFTTIKEVEEYPFPEFIPDIEVIRQKTDKVKGKSLAAVTQYEPGTFEQACAFMGMEQVLSGMYIYPDMMKLLFEHICAVKSTIAQAYVKAGVDILWIGDDIGSQNGALMSPEMWREFLLPSLKKIIAAARSVRNDIPVAYHSCGSIGFAIEGLIEAGVDILQSIQPECNDAAEIAETYGDRIAFWAGVGSQSTMSHGSTDDVENEVKYMIGTLGEDGGYMCAPAHCLGPEAPLENIFAFVEAIEKYGYYK
jgi:uroporphyrinogen decarboxylase